jgi:archaellum component FlaC
MYQKITILAILATLGTGCGIAQDVTQMCGGELDHACDAFLGQDPDTVDDNEDRIGGIEDDIRDIEERLTELEELYLLLSSNLDTLAVQVEFLESLGKDVSALESQMSTLQTQLNDVVADVAVLEGHDSVVEFIDPCGDGPGFDEVILKTASGKLVAYFENGGNRFLSELDPGKYMTTDQQGCIFSVDSGLNVID